MFITYAFALVVGTVMLLVDLVIGTAIVVTSISAVWLSARGTKTTGHVAHVEERQPGRSAKVRVAYETPTGSHEIGGRSTRPRIGEPMTVWYHPGNSAKGTAIVHPWRRAALGIPVVLWVAALGVGMVTGSAWYFAGTHASLQLPVGGGSLGLAVALPFAYFAVARYALVLRWRRMTQTHGEVIDYSDRSPVGPGILVSFESNDGKEEFWDRAGYVAAGVGDIVTVYYNPSKPAGSATVQDASDVRSMATFCAVLAVIIGGPALWIFIEAMAGTTT